MSNILDFPVAPTTGPGRASAFVAPSFAEIANIRQRQRKIADFNTKTAPACTPSKQFRADLYLVNNGQDVAFSLLYPLGPISHALVAAMLRRAALAIDPPKV